MKPPRRIDASELAKLPIRGRQVNRLHEELYGFATDKLLVILVRDRYDGDYSAVSFRKKRGEWEAVDLFTSEPTLESAEARALKWFGPNPVKQIDPRVEKKLEDPNTHRIVADVLRETGWDGDPRDDS